MDKGDPRQPWQGGWRTRIYARPKLTPVQRDEITRRLAEGEPVRALALEFKVSRETINRHR